MFTAASFFYIVKFAVVTTLQNKSFSSALAVTLYKQALPIEVTGELQIKQLYPVYFYVFKFRFFVLSIYFTSSCT